MVIPRRLTWSSCALAPMLAVLLAGSVVETAGQGGGRGAAPPGQGPGTRGGRGPQQPARDTSTTSAVGTAAISGTVLLEGAGGPVRRARVTLSGPELGGGRSAMSDEQGRFSFQALPAGRFTMTAAKAGYVDMTYGAKRPGRPGTPIQLADGQKLDRAVITMPRGSVITGIVVDENGDPSPGTQVRAMRYVIRTGEKTLQQAGQDQSDDRGMYRIYQLQPGDYVVSAAPRNMTIGNVRESIASEIAALMQQAQAMGGGRGGPAPGQLAGFAGGPGAQQVLARAAELQQQLAAAEQDQPTAYAPVYYPGTTTPSAALTVTLGSGEERSGVDFRLQLLATARVDGTVMSPDGTLPPNTSVALVPADRGGMPTIPGLGTNTTRVNANGEFSFRNVTPGLYSLQARANILRPTDPNAPSPQLGRGGGALLAGGGGGRGGQSQITQVLWAATDVSISGQDQSRLSLTLQPGMTVSGRVEFQGAGMEAPADLTRIRVSMTPRGQQPFEVGAIPPGTVDTSGRFTLTGIPPGRYVLSATVPSAGTPTGTRGPGPAGPAAGPASQWTLKSALVDGRDALDFPIDIGPNTDISNATLTFTTRTQALSGMIQDAAGGPTSDFTIIVFPSDRRYWLPLSRRIGSARPGTDGKFSLPGLPVGDYRLTAVTDVEPGEWYDPAFLTQLLPASLPITLAEGEKKIQDIKLAGRTPTP